MKKITFLLVFLITSCAFSQKIVIENFDANRSAALSGADNFTAGNGSITQVADPDGIRGDVLQLIINESSVPWQGAQLVFQGAKPVLTTGNDQTVDIMIHSLPAQAILAKVTGGGPDAATSGIHPGGGWASVTFDFSVRFDSAGPANGTYNNIIFYPGWIGGAGCVNGCYPASSNAGPTPANTILIDEINAIPDAVPPVCNTLLGSSSATCDTLGFGASDDTYTATVAYSGAANGNTFVVGATSGTIGGDDPNVVAAGTITVTGLTENTPVTITLDDTAGGGFCSLSALITGPVCTPIPTCSDGVLNNGEIAIDCGGPNCAPCGTFETCTDGIQNNGETDVDCGGPNCTPCNPNFVILEDWEGLPPALAFSNGPGSANVVLDNTGAGNGVILEIVTAAGSAPWQQAELTLQDDFLDLSTANKTVFVEWYSVDPFDALLRADGPVSGGPATAEAAHPGGGWQTLEFDFNFQAQALGVPNAVYSRLFFFNLWNIAAGDFQGGASGSTASETFVNIVQGPNTSAVCSTTLGLATATCVTSEFGATNDTYDVSIPFTGGNTGFAFIVTASSGTVGGDDPSAVAAGTITVSGITEGTDLNLTVNNTVAGGPCALSTDVTSPSCVPVCNTTFDSTSATCNTEGAGLTDDTYTASITYSGGANGRVFVLNASSGTVGGDDPNVVAAGTITVTGITEGTDITVTLDDTADGGACALSENITSPACIPPVGFVTLEDFEGTPIISTANGLGGANVVTDPLDFGNTVLEIISDAGGQSWQQANVLMQDFFMDVNATAGYTVQVDVYATQDFTMLARIDDLIGPGPAAAPSATSQDFVTGSGWQTLTFSFNQPEDLPAIANGQYSQIGFLPNWAGNGTGTSGVNPNYNVPTNFTLYVDNIKAVQGDALPIVPTTYVYNNGVWAPSDPLGGESNALDDINIINGDITISSDLECEDLTIQPSASVTIQAGATVTASTTTLFSQSSLFSSLIVEGAITGPVSYHRFTAQLATVGGTNDLASPPLSGQTFGSFANDAGNGNLAFQGTARAYAPYNTVAGEYQNYDVVANAGTIMTSGVGYRAATIDGNRLIYTGTPLSGDVLGVPITDAAAGKAWNLIGNPYSSYLDFDTFFNANLGQLDAAGPFQAIYGYDGSATNGWVVWNLATIADGAVTELIAPGQGFFVKSQAGGGLVDYAASMRRSGSSDDFIQGRNASPLDVALNKLSLTSATNTANTSIYFIEGTTRGLDAGYDAGSYGGAGEAGFLIYTNLVEDNAGLDIAIQSLAYNDFNDVVIPVGVKASAGSPLTIALENSSYSPIPANVNVYLEDTLENTLTLLNTSDYTFTPTTDLFGTGRFFLRYSADTLSLNPTEALNELIIYANQNDKDIMIKGLLTDASIAELYDIQGRLVLSNQLEQSSTTNTVDVSTISAGVYIIKVSNNNSTKTQKLIIK